MLVYIYHCCATYNVYFSPVETSRYCSRPHGDIGSWKYVGACHAPGVNARSQLHIPNARGPAHVVCPLARKVVGLVDFTWSTCLSVPTV